MQEGKIPTVLIIGAGPGGLTLYHALIKNKDKKEFNVKIFEREASPTDRWQGYFISINVRGAKSLMNCVPPSIASKLSKAIPNPIPDAESNGITLTDDTGKRLVRPPFKQVKDVHELAKVPKEISAIISYRDILREVLLEDVPVQWNKKCVGFEETENGVWAIFEDGSREFGDILVGADGINSPVRKQKIPELKVFDYGVNILNANVAVPKSLMDKSIRIHGNSLIQLSLGIKGDWTFSLFRLIPVEQDPDHKNDSVEPHYKVTLSFAYPSKLDIEESDKIKVDDKDPASVINYTKHLIQTLRPKSELTDIQLKLWDYVPKTAPNDPEKYPFKTYNPTQRRKLQDLDPLSVNTWKSSRVTLLGDAAHAINPIFGLGTNNAIKDADLLSQALLNYSPENYISYIQEYENEMRERNSADVLRARAFVLRQTRPIGFFGIIIRNTIMRIINFFMNLKSYK
ncbi:FAD/NAD(P)-binding domain-containing protein [Rhizophagus irregularis]|nr:FAD/NAD(P)-binding domain-containing protein [Rhizophagus irregularis]